MKYKLLKSVFHDPSADFEAEYKKRISQENTNILSFSIHGYPAFFTGSSDVLELCYKIQQINAKIARLTSQIPALDTLLMRCLIKEIQMSNEIEGVHSSRKELLAIQNSADKDIHTRFAGQLRQYRQLLRSKPAVPEDSSGIRALYDALLIEDIRAVSSENLPDGELFRASPVSVVNGNGVIHSGIMPEKEMIRILDRTLHRLQNTVPLVAAAVFHFVFGYVHPFYDGNGRLNRYLSTAMLAQDFEMAGVLQLSLVIREHRHKYYKAFEQCESELNRGDLTPFLITFLELILMSFENGADLLQESSRLYTEGLKTLKNKNLPRHHQEFLHLMLKNMLFGYQGLTYTEIADELSISESTARNLVRKFRLLLYEEKTGKVKTFSLNRDFQKSIDSEAIAE